MGYVHQEYPKHRHHAVHPFKHVADPDEEAELTPDSEGWVDDLQDLETRGEVSSDAMPRMRSRRMRPNLIANSD
jgi:hypothetical protein